MLITLSESDIKFRTMRSSGSGGQHINKVETAVLLIYDVLASTLPDESKRRLLSYKDGRIGKDGIIRIQANQYRSQHRNRKEAVERLQNLVDLALKPVKKRKATKPSKKSNLKRLEAKKKRGEVKKMRRKLDS